MSPKQTFLQNQGAAKAHANLIAKPEFRSALDVAMLEFTRDAIKATADNPAAVAHRLEGAHQFVRTFLELSERVTITKTRDPDNLMRE